MPRAGHQVIRPALLALVSVCYFAAIVAGVAEMWAALLGDAGLALISAGVILGGISGGSAMWHWVDGRSS